MTSTTVLQGSRLLLAHQRWTGAVIGLLIGFAAVCHGCHGGDRDDELSLTGGKPRVERRRDEPGGSPNAFPKRDSMPLYRK
ncbi:MAG TPA: hypothetical protein DDY78_12405 [Planctomycetales bacterium]|jgi:hypothetical protein|nr:hypothetical protein [Planctomycetales bacterium]